MDISGEDWNEYTRNILIFANTTYFTGVALIEPNGSRNLYSFASLIANTSYSLYAWADNFSGKTIAAANTTKSTLPLQAPAIIMLTYSSALISSNIDLINKGIALAFGADPLRVISFGGISRRLGGTSSSLYISNPLSTENPFTTANAINVGTLTTTINEAGLNLTVINKNINQGIDSQFSTAGLVGTFNTSGNSILYVNFTTGGLGLVCCILEYNLTTNNNLNSYDVLFGYDRDGLNAFWHTCISEPGSYNDNILWDFSKLYANMGNYIVTCTACNNYPLLPQCIADSQMITYTYNWKNLTTISASSIILAFWIFVAVLV